MGYKQLSLILCFFWGFSESFAQRNENIFPPGWVIRTLENGMETAILQDTSLPLTLAQISIEAGSKYEPRRMSGWSNILTSLMLGSNRIFPAKDSFRYALSSQAILYDQFVSPELITFRLQGLQDKSEFIISWLSVSVHAPLYSGEEVASVKERLVQQAEEEMKDPLFYLRQGIEQRLWGSENHRRIPTGTATGLVRAEIAGLMQFRKHFWVPYRSLLIIISPEPTETSFAYVQKYFSRWTDAASDPEVAFPLPEWPELKHSELFIVHQEYSKVPVFMAGWRIPESIRERAEILVEILNHPNGRFHKAFMDSTKVRDIQFQISGNGLYLTLLPEPRNYLLHGPDSLMMQFRRLCNPGFFQNQEIKDAQFELRKRTRKEQEKLSSRALYYARNRLEKKADIHQVEINAERLQSDAALMFLKQPMVAGFISSTTLDEVSGLSDYFYSLPDTGKLAYSLEGDTLLFAPELDTFARNIWYRLRWSPGERVKIQVYIPGLGINDNQWTAQKTEVQRLLKQSFYTNAQVLPERFEDVHFEFIKDNDSLIPGISTETTYHEYPDADRYQYYLTPLFFSYDRAIH